MNTHDFHDNHVHDNDGFGDHGRSDRARRGRRGAPHQHGQRGPGRHPGPLVDNPFGDNPFSDNPFGDGRFGGRGRGDGGAQLGPGGPRGPRARRGDVRSAIIDVLRAGPANGYQVIQQITERSEGVWRPSPGSVYPTMQQLEDEGLLEPEPEAKGRSVRLTERGQSYAEEHAEQLAAVWRPFRTESSRTESQDPSASPLRPEVGKLMAALWQVAANGDDAQRRAGVEIIAEARRRLYLVLADDGTQAPSAEPAGAASTEASEPTDA